jgi:pullulanase/glycogen debranching enzyme
MYRHRPSHEWGDDRQPRRPWIDTVAYEAHVKGLTQLHPGVPDPLRGSYAALGHPSVIEHLVKLGVTAVELLPIHAFADDRFLVEKGLRNYWATPPSPSSLRSRAISGPRVSPVSRARSGRCTTPASR